MNKYLKKMSEIEVFDWDKTHVECHICGAMVKRGIANYSQHWVDNHSNGKMDFVNSVDKSQLLIEDKMELIKKEFGINQ
jgi:hypothetical protein